MRARLGRQSTQASSPALEWRDTRARTKAPTPPGRASLRARHLRRRGRGLPTATGLPPARRERAREARKRRPPPTMAATTGVIRTIGKEPSSFSVSATTRPRTRPRGTSRASPSSGPCSRPPHDDLRLLPRRLQSLVLSPRVAGPPPRRRRDDRQSATRPSGRSDRADRSTPGGSGYASGVTGGPPYALATWPKVAGNVTGNRRPGISIFVTIRGGYCAQRRSALR